MEKIQNETCNEKKKCSTLGEMNNPKKLKDVFYRSVSYNNNLPSCAPFPFKDYAQSPKKRGGGGRTQSHKTNTRHFVALIIQEFH